MRKRTMNAAAAKSTPDFTDATEPLGIVISSGSRDEESPRFAAYVWGPVPEAELGEALAVA